MLAASLFGLFVAALSGAYLYGEEASALSGNRVRAILFAEEGLEALRSIRDASWSNISAGTYGLATTSSEWALSGSSDTSGIFTRQISLSAIDANRFWATSTVTWQQNPSRTGSVALSTRITNWQALGVDWSDPSEEASLNLSGNNDGVKVQTTGNYAYVVRSGGTDFQVVDVSNPASPSAAGSLSLDGTLSNIFVSGSYAYVTSNSNSSEQMIVDISYPNAPTLVGTYNDSGNENATGVFVSGSYAYVTLDGGSEFVVVNISNPAAPSYAGGVSLPSAARAVYVSGTYAYVGTDDNSEELVVVNVSNPASPSQVASLNLSGNDDADTVSGSGSLVYVGRAGGDFHTVSVASPASPSLLGTLNLGGSVSDISLENPDGYALVALGSSSDDFAVVDISAPASPSLAGALSVSGNLSGVAYSSSKERAFAVGDGNSNEFVVYAPQ